ncbi:diadenosine tetraphosphate (Ap4A) HIT family hydrolase [Kitasatospora sp. MAP12-15]|nr:diadenosine tetraphosphate (Ap4A) HIT family hydrolase [Kitasatospora sp. MAP12-44]
MSDCFSCANTAVLSELPPRELIGVDEHWRVAYAVNCSLPGWLVLVPRRHVTRVAELTDAEAAGLGLWQVRLSRALEAVTGCEKTYVAQFGEAPGFGHVHFHLVPRSADLAAELRGPGVFAHLAAAGSVDEAAMDEAAMDELAVRLRARLEESAGQRD